MYLIFFPWILYSSDEDSHENHHPEAHVNDIESKQIKYALSFIWLNNQLFKVFSVVYPELILSLSFYVQETETDMTYHSLAYVGFSLYVLVVIANQIYSLKKVWN